MQNVVVAAEDITTLGIVRTVAKKLTTIGDTNEEIIIHQ